MNRARRRRGSASLIRGEKRRKTRVRIDVAMAALGRIGKRSKRKNAWDEKMDKAKSATQNKDQEGTSRGQVNAAIEQQGKKKP